MNFVPPVGFAYEFAQISPAIANYLLDSLRRPAGRHLALMKALADGDGQTAKAVADDIAWANEPHHAITGSQEIFASYNIQLEKVLMARVRLLQDRPDPPAL